MSGNLDLARAVRDLIRELKVESVLSNVADACGWTVASLDTESGTETLFGYWLDPVEAMKWANEHEASVNRDLGGDAPWRVSVRPVIRVAESKRGEEKDV